MSTGQRPDLNRALYARAVELLEDREWHSYEAVMRELIKLVPPGVALRRNEQERHAGNGGPDERVKPRSIEERIRFGARAVVRTTLGNRRVFETDPIRRDGRIDPERQVRLIGTPRALNPGTIGELNATKRELKRVRAQLDLAIEELRRRGGSRFAARLLDPEDDLVP